MTKKKLQVKTVESKSSEKITKSDPTVLVRGDRVTANLSHEVYNGCWIGFGYESDVRSGESLDEAKERVFNEVVDTVTKRAEELSEEE